jgi:cytidylate kinase
MLLMGRGYLQPMKCNIAIDGPAGAGKSTVARILAKRLGYLHVDTGALYRALTLLVLRRGIDPTDESAIAQLFDDADIDMISEPGGVRVLLNGEDVTEAIRAPEVSETVSVVAQHPKVRDHLLHLQRQLAAGGGVVMDGRDIGTVVLPDAQLKIFLTASAEERARRRMKELRNQGHKVTYKDILLSIRARDNLDAERPVAPLRAATDAIPLDTTGKDLDTVVEEILGYLSAVGRCDGCSTDL